MGRVSTYLNFNGKTEEAFNFYKSVFGTQFLGEIMRYKDMPKQERQSPVPAHVETKVMHMELPIYGGHILMGTDSVEEFGFKITVGNNIYIMLEPDTKEETEMFYKSLSEGGKIEMPLQEMFWGAYYASFFDKFGTGWMLNCQKK